MQEKSVTAAGNTYKLQEPFFVLATQNPIEQEGTYPLPEAQLDRFMFNILLDYPKLHDEIAIVSETTSDAIKTVEKVMSAEEILYFQHLVRRIPVNEHVLKYAVNLAAKSRPNTEHALAITNQYVNWGAGPRASQFLILGAKVHAAVSGKYSPDVEDVIAVAFPILRHRIVRNYKAEAEGITVDNIVQKLIDSQKDFN
jgi:MoxR-like ATPase